MSFARQWFRLELRRQWRSLLALAVVVAVVAGVAMAAIAGARRGVQAYPKLVERTLGAHVRVIPQEASWAELMALPEVETGSRLSYLDFWLEAVAEEDQPNVEIWHDRAGMDRIERPIVLSGRLTDPARSDEVVVTPRFLKRFDKRVGDTVTIRFYTPEQRGESEAVTAEGDGVTETTPGEPEESASTDVSDAGAPEEPGVEVLEAADEATAISEPEANQDIDHAESNPSSEDAAEKAEGEPTPAVDEASPEEPVDVTVPVLLEDPPAGRIAEVRIVGAVRSAFYVDDHMAPAGTIVGGPGMFEGYRSEILAGADPDLTLGMIRLRDGSSAVPAFTGRLAGRAEVFDLTSLDRDNVAGHGLEADFLLAFGGLLGAIGVLPLSVAVARHASASRTQAEELRGPGLSGRIAVPVCACAPAMAAAAGATAAVLGAWFASRWFPIGRAGYNEPAPGFEFRWRVLLPGAAAVVAIGAAAALFGAWSAVRRGRSGRIRAAQFAGPFRHLGLPVPVSVAARFVFESGSGRTRTPARSALLGASAGVAGLVAGLVIWTGTEDAIHHPERFGIVAHAEAVLGYEGEEDDSATPYLQHLAASPKVAAMEQIDENIASVQGGPAIEVEAFTPVKGELPFVFIEGSRPSAADEIALRRTTARELAVAVGETLTLVGDKTRPARRFLVSGVVLPSSDSRVGAMVTRAGYDQLFESYQLRSVSVAFDDPSALDPHAVAEQIDEAIAADLPGTEVALSVAGEQIAANGTAALTNVRSMPAMIAGVLAMFGMVSIGYAVVSTSRRRRYEVCLLRTLGITRGQLRGAFVLQGLMVGLTAVVVGAPLGLLMGRLQWRRVTDNVSLHYLAPFPASTLAAALSLLVLGAGLFALGPGRSAARAAISRSLRMERMGRE